MLTENYNRTDAFHLAVLVWEDTPIVVSLGCIPVLVGGPLSSLEPSTFNTALFVGMATGSPELVVETQYPGVSSLRDADIPADAFLQLLEMESS